MSKNQVPTPHMEAKYGEIAKCVIMSGDPLRAKFIADGMLKDTFQYNNVRGMLGFTGTYDGKTVSVQGHGMGIPSIGIYSFELFNFYDVDTIIRVGTCGSYNPNTKPGTVIIATEAVSDSNYGYQFGIDPKGYVAKADAALAAKAVANAEKMGLKYAAGRVLSSDVFYDPEKRQTNMFSDSVLSVEMEAYALYINANYSGKKALTIVTVSDNITTGEAMTAQERQTGLVNAIRLAFESGLK